MLDRRTLRSGLAGLMAIGAIGASCGPVPSAPSSSGAVDGTRATADPASALATAWTGYKRAFIGADGRVADPAAGGRSTSEGQSYALLRAAWMGDRTTFDTVWRWTSAHLQVRSDGLFAWLWKPGQGVADQSSASDADSDIALALLFGSRRFASSAYLTAAQRVLAGIWHTDVAEVAGMPVLTAGSWAPSSAPIAIDPSYFSPYAYRVFAAADVSHPWSQLVDSSYTVLQRCTTSPLASGHSAGLPPNWCGLRGDGTVVPLASMNQADDYGYDAFRVIWRVALDSRWNGEPRARRYLEGATFLRDRWMAGGRVDPVYGHDGTVVASYNDPTVDAAVLALCDVLDTSCASQVRSAVLATLNTTTGLFGDTSNYYEQNWAWFGLAMAAGRLPNLWEAAA